MKLITKPLTIDHYAFGAMSIAGRDYRTDLILYPNGRIQSGWWRIEGHNLARQDIDELLSEPFDKLVVGTGASGQMSVSEDVTRQCRERGIELVTCPTAEAVVLYNHAAEKGENVAACFHLTC